ncbi:MAG: SEC-C domain-containing protein [Ardenticatenaceae bacterium]|nr:SEC-C domain-containing protein [Ardenticatenaceae bacterium]MCB9446309.1 SEC-C domain-containing protein [Ardenticatenaceae bacterium]
MLNPTLLNEDGEHDFVFPSDISGVFIDEGFWENFTQRPERKAQIAANRISYSWDALIETFNKHILDNTLYRSSHPDIDSSEKIMRFLARESRTRRRLLANSLHELIGKTPLDQRATRIMTPSKEGDPFYVFLLLPHLEGIAYEEYREGRGRFLEACCMVTKLKFPHANDIVGIATETGLNEHRSEDAIYLDASIWGPAQQAEAQSLQNDLGLLTETKMFHDTIYEYPDLSHRKSNQRRNTKKIPRNSLCPCGSGKKYKKCCGFPGN